MYRYMMYPWTGDKGVLSIHDLAAQCRKLLEQCMEKSLLRKFDWAEKTLEDFNLWAAKFGIIFDEKSAAHNNRILQDSDSGHLLPNILLLLKSWIEECLKKCEKCTKPEEKDMDDPAAVLNSNSILAGREQPLSLQGHVWAAKNYHPTDDCTRPGFLDGQYSNTSGELMSAKRNVRGSLNQLLQVSDTIRSSYLKLRYLEADKQFKAGDHYELRAHLENWLRSHSPELNGNAHNAMTPIQERLIQANLRRGNRFLYCQRYSQDHDAEYLDDYEEDDLELQEVLGRSVDTLSESTVQSSKGSPDLYETSPKISSLHHPKSSTIELYPKPPRAHGFQSFKCLCCFMNLPSMYQEERAWKDHLKDDMRPYTCFIDSCPSPETLYASRTDWLHHIQHEHEQCWQCLLCNASGSPLHLLITVDDFVQHVMEWHKDDIPEDVPKSSVLLFAKQRAAPFGVSHCPLCDHKADKGQSDSDELLEHIAEHIHEFSLESLPRRKLGRFPENDDLVDTAPKRNFNDSHINEQDPENFVHIKDWCEYFGIDSTQWGDDLSSTWPMPVKRRKIEDSTTHNQKSLLDLY